MKITIDTKNKTLTLLEEVELRDLMLFLSGIQELEGWKIIPFVKENTNYIGIPYKEPEPYVYPWPSYPSDPIYSPYIVTCNSETFYK